MKRSLIPTGLLGLCVLAGCSTSYAGGGYEATEEELTKPASGSVELSSTLPTRTEIENAISEVIVRRARAITELPHAYPLFEVSCRDVPTLAPATPLPCQLKQNKDAKRAYPDFTAELTSVEGTSVVISVNSPTYWAYLDKTLG